MLPRGELLVRLSQKDRVTLDNLDKKQPQYESTKGVDIKKINIKKLKSIFLETTENTEVPEVTFPTLTNACPTTSELNHSSSEIHALGPTSDFDTVNHFTSLTVYPSTSAEINNSSSEKDGFSDSGSEYIPDSVASPDSELLFSSESNHSLELKDLRKESSTKISSFNKKGEVKSSTKNGTGRVKRDKKEHCLYCEKNVTNFSRHIIRKHKNESEVSRIISLPKKSIERKCLLEKIRKKGNFINSFGKNGFINPVRRPQTAKQKATSDYLPCSECKGFYRKTYLYRHIKTCHKDKKGESKHAQAKGLSLLFLADNNNFEDLRVNVFPRMQADEITQTVIDDPLIKYYGQRYFRCHKEKHLINTASQRMRELARFLMLLKTDVGKHPQLIDYLKPNYFDELVSATNKLAGYDSNKDTFKSPSLALRWATVLKQVCDTAMFICLKENDTTKNKEIKTLKNMIDAQFRYYVSTNAHKDLSLKNWQKGNMLPLTEDVIKMNQFVINEEETWATKLESDLNNITYVRKLTEALLAHVILLNRKRSGEAQRITIDDYLRKDEVEVQDVDQSLSITEKILVKNVRRFVIRGKKGRSVPVIFTPDMQKHTELLLMARKNVASGNIYLFANPATENSFVWAYAVLKKMALSSKVSNIDAITATRLRKHIATIAQLISMDNNDIEQLATHLGHEKSTHLNFYRQTDDKLQIAKVSKLLLLMEKKSIAEYRGKTLESIDLDIPDLEENDNAEDQTDNDWEGVPEDLCGENDETDKTEELKELTTSVKNKKLSQLQKRNTTSKGTINNENDFGGSDNQVKKGRVLIPWTDEQKKLAQNFFKRHLKSKKPPKRNECDELKDRHPKIFNNKTWAQIKIFIVNQYNKK